MSTVGLGALPSGPLLPSRSALQFEGQRTEGQDLGAGNGVGEGKTSPFQEHCDILSSLVSLAVEQAA